jgi:hypothetical protein
MNNYESGLLRELVDVNYEMSQNHNPIVKKALLSRYHEIQSELIDSMGEREYKDYIGMMRQMFAPKGGYGDESPEEVERMYASI